MPCHIDYVKLIAGDIHVTLSKFHSEWPNKIALAIWDVDLDYTTESILNQIWEIMSSGGKLFLDEYSRGGGRKLPELADLSNHEDLISRYVSAGFIPRV